MHWQTVCNTFNPAEAQVIRSRLEAAGFEVYVRNELSSLSIDGYSMAAGGIDIQVPDDRAEDARALAMQIESPDDED